MTDKPLDCTAPTGEMGKVDIKQHDMSYKDTLPQLLGQLCGHAMNRDAKGVLDVFDKINANYRRIK